MESNTFELHPAHAVLNNVSTGTVFTDHCDHHKHECLKLLYVTCSLIPWALFSALKYEVFDLVKLAGIVSFLEVLINYLNHSRRLNVAI